MRLRPPAPIVVIGIVLAAGSGVVGAAPTARTAADAPLTVARWGPALFEEARRSDLPVLLLVGDPACARCRLDEAAALADADTVSLLQRAFVVSRVDRYDRPDLDDLFATAVDWLGGERGYPMAVALMSDGRPFAGRAGVSADDRGQRPSLHRFVLRAWSDFTHERAAVEARAARAVEALARAQQVERAAGSACAGGQPALRGLEQAFDARLGGFGAGESFAPAATLRLLLALLEKEEDAAVRRMLLRTLDALASAEQEPATLARRALLIECFVRAHALTASAAYRARASALADGALRLRDAGGAFIAFDPGEDAPRIVTGWNGLMIGALALSGATLDRPQDVEAARTAARVVMEKLGPPSRLRRGDGAGGPAALEDHAYLAEGLLRLDAATAGRERRWLDDAAALVDAAVGRFFDPAQGGFFDAVASPELFVPPALPQRLRSGYDGTLPAANAVMAGVLLRLSRAAAQPRYAELARGTEDAFAAQLQRAPRGMEGLAAACVEMQPAPAGPGPEQALPAREERDGIAFAAEAPERLSAGQPFTLRLRITVPEGRYVVAHEPGAPDLVGLSVSVPGDSVMVAGPPRFPLPQRLHGRWDSGLVNVYSGTAVVEVPLRLPADAARVPAQVRVRVVFQACRHQAATCARPQSVVLDAPCRLVAGP